MHLGARRYIVNQFRVISGHQSGGQASKTPQPPAPQQELPKTSSEVPPPGHIPAVVGLMTTLRCKFLRIASPASQEIDGISLARRICARGERLRECSSAKSSIASKNNSSGTGNGDDEEVHVTVRQPSVFIGNQFGSRYIKRTEVLRLVEQHIRGNFLRMVKRKCRGLPLPLLFMPDCSTRKHCREIAERC